MGRKIDLDHSLSDSVLGGAFPHDGAPELSESAWIEVIQTMDAVYAELVRNQVALEERNAELAEAKSFTDSILGAMSDVIVVIDRAGRIASLNPALLRLLDLTAETLTGRPISDLFHGPSPEFIACLTGAQPGEGVSDREVQLRDAAGEPVPVALNCTPLRGAGGRIEGAVMVGRPVGELRRAYEALNSAHNELNLAHQELKRAQEQIIQSEKMASLGRLVAGVAHELNNPISFVFGNIHALRRYLERIERFLGEGGGDAALREELHIERIRADLPSLMAGTLEGAERVKAIVEDLRRFSALDRDKRVAVDVGEVARQAAQWLSAMDRSGIPIVCRCPEPCRVEGAPGRLEQVFVNLLRNALDAMLGRAGEVEIVCRREGESAVVEVRDRGCGIKPEDLPRLFEPFFTTKPVGVGTGLGLSVSYGIVEHHGGTLSAANRAGGGAVVTVRLPLKG